MYLKNRRKIFALLMCVMLVLTGMNLSGLCIAGVKADDNTNPLPAGFITKLQLGTIDSDENFEAYGEDDKIARNSDVVLRFDYDISEEDKLTKGVPYSFELVTDAIAIKDGDSVTFPVSDGLITVANGKAENLKNADGTDAGKIKVTLTFTDDAADYLKGSGGVFWFSASFNADKIANTGKQSISISTSTGYNWTKDLNFEVTPVEASLNVSKEIAKTETVGDTTYITWKITATPSLSGYNDVNNNYLTDFVITDILPDPSMKLVVDTAKTESKNNSLLNTYDISYTNGDAGTITGITLKSKENTTINAAPVTFYVVTKYTSVDVIDYLGEKKVNEISWTNTASAEMSYPDNEKDGNGNPVISNKETDPVLANYKLKGVELDKKGEVVPTDGTIMWTVTATNGIGVEKPYLLDTLPAGLVLDTSKSITVVETGGQSTAVSANTSSSYSANTYIYTSNAAGSDTLKIYLGSGSAEQTITYYTKYKDTGASIGSGSLENKVEFGYGDDPNKIITSKTASVTPGNTYMKKEGVYDRSTHTIDWTVTLSNLHMTTGTLEVKDVFDTYIGQILQTDSFGITTNSTNTTLRVENNADGTCKIVDNNNNSEVGTITINSSANGVTTGFDINFENNAFASGGILDGIDTVTITYKTKLNEDEIGTWINQGPTINNTVTIDADGIPSLSNTVNESQMALTNPVVTDVITDTDLNWEYKRDGLEVTQGGNTLNIGTDKNNLVSGKTYFVEYTPDSNGQPSMTVYLPTISGTTVGTKDAEFEITYYTTIADEESLKKLATNNTIWVENKAALSGSPIKAASPVNVYGNFPINAGQISKTGTDMDRMTREITWTIDVNKNNAIIDGEGNKVAVCDVLQPGLLYLEDTLKICELTEEKGTWTEGGPVDPYDVTYDDETRKLTITFKDDSAVGNRITKAYRIRFNTRVLVSGEYSNSASFAADKDTDNSNSSQKQVSGKFGNGYTSLKMKGAALILIQGKNTSDNAVSGGEFELYKEGGSTPVATLTTDGTWLSSDGDNYNASISGLPYGKYILRRTGTPGNYKDNALEEYPITLSEENDQAIIEILYLQDTDTANMADVIFSKQAAGSGGELPGAEIKLTSNRIDLSAVKPSEKSGGKDFTNDGMAITWISTDTPVELTMLPDGEYTMTETAAPEGWQYADAVRFKIEKGLVYLYNETTADYENVSVSTVTMTDESLGATFSKTIAAGGLEVPGATLELTGESDLSNVEKTAGPDFELSADKKTVMWISTDTPLSLKGLPDGIYILHEEAAPDGYKYAEDMTVKIDGEDVYVLTDGIYKKAEYGRVYMVDAVSGGIFSKVDAGAGKELPGAAVKLIYEGSKDFTAVKQVTITDVTAAIDTINKTVSWVSGENPVILAYLPDGNYTFHEEGAPEGYAYASDMKFKIENGNIYLMNETGTYDTVSTDKIVMVDEAAVKTDDEENSDKNTEEDNEEEEDAGGAVVDTGDNIYPVLLLCAVLMLLSAAVMYAAYYRKNKDLTE